MADLRTKESLSLKEKILIADKIADAINKEHGKKIIGRIGRKEDKDLLERLRIRFIPTPSQNFNAVTGGGFPRRRVTIMAGLPDSGKTGMALETIGYNQQKDPNFMACWLESENSLEESYMFDTLKIDPKRFTLIEQDRKGAGEKALDILEANIASGIYDMIVINSLKGLVPSEEFAKSLADGVMGTQSRMNSRMMRKYISPVAENDTALVIITHLSTEIGKLYGDPFVITGGYAIIYFSSLIVDLRKKVIGDGEIISKDDGIKVGVTVKRNHCVPNRSPYMKTDYYAVFGQGIERKLTVVENAIAQGILVQSGAYYKDVNEEGEIRIDSAGNKMQWQGKKAIKNYLEQNPDYFKRLITRTSGDFEQMSEEEITEAKEEEEAIKQLAKGSTEKKTAVKSGTKEHK